MKQSHSGSRAFLAGLFFAAVLAAPAFADPPKYRATVIQVPAGFRFGFGEGINDVGEVVGTYRTHVDFPGIFVYSDGALQDLGTLGGMSATASDINESGQITGRVVPLAGGVHAFLYSNGILDELGDPGDRSVGLGLNDAGEVTGVIDFPNGQAFLFSGSMMQRLPSPASGCAGPVAEGFFQGNDINNSGHVTGTAFVRIPAGCQQRPVVYRDGQTVAIDLPPGLEGQGRSINESGQVAISAFGGPEGSIGYLYTDGQLEEIGPVTPFGINNFGWVVGNAGLDEIGAFLYVDGELFDLEDLVVNFGRWDHFRGATDINDSGQVTGTGITAGGSWRAFLLTPLAIKARIDIKPGKKKNSLNPTSGGNVPVAVLSTAKFDATQVDWETVRFGRREATEVHQRSHVRDVDGDGDMDFLLHFKIQQTGIRCRDTMATLTGRIFNGQSFTGSDAIRPINCQ
jgi:probable HAF family extracellular repeat protein